MFYLSREERAGLREDMWGITPWAAPLIFGKKKKRNNKGYKEERRKGRGRKCKYLRAAAHSNSITII